MLDSLQYCRFFLGLRSQSGGPIPEVSRGVEARKEAIVLHLSIDLYTDFSDRSTLSILHVLFVYCVHLLDNKFGVS